MRAYLDMYPEMLNVIWRVVLKCIVEPMIDGMTLEFEVDLDDYDGEMSGYCNLDLRLNLVKFDDSFSNWELVRKIIDDIQDFAWKITPKDSGSLNVRDV